MKPAFEESSAKETAPTVLVPARRPYAGLLASAALGLGAAALLLAAQPASVLGWALLALTPLAAITATAMLLPGAHGLILEPDGFTIRYLWHDQFVPWSEVKSFAVDERGLPAFSWAEGHPARRAAVVSLRHAILPGALPDTYGRSARRLVAELEEWRRRNT